MGNLLRSISNLQYKQIFATNQRTFMNVEHFENNCIVGMLKGNKYITEDMLIHITNVGDFAIEEIK